MAPIAIEPVEVPAEIRFPTKTVAPPATVKLPLINNGSLDNLEQFDVTPVIGTEFPEANLVDMLNAPNADELLTELALTSKSSVSKSLLAQLIDAKSPSVASSSSASRITSPTSSRSSLSPVWVSSLASQNLPASTSTLSSRPMATTVVRQTRRSVPSALVLRKIYLVSLIARTSAQRSRAAFSGTRILPLRKSLRATAACDSLSCQSLAVVSYSIDPLTVLLGERRLTSTNRYTLGIRLRTLRPSLPSNATVFRGQDLHVRGTRL